MHIFSTDNEFNLLSSFETGERTMATPAFTDGKDRGAYGKEYFIV